MYDRYLPAPTSQDPYIISLALILTPFDETQYWADIANSPKNRSERYNEDILKTFPGNSSSQGQGDSLLAQSRTDGQRL